MGLGTWRFFLAFIVAAWHLYAGMIPGRFGVSRSLQVDTLKLSPYLGYRQDPADWMTTLTMAYFLPQKQGPFLLALAANVDAGFAAESRNLRYKGLATGMLAFSAGALLCHYRDRLRALEAPR